MNFAGSLELHNVMWVHGRSSNSVTISSIVPYNLYV